MFTYGGAYNHTLNGGLKLVALSPERLAFSGTGFSGTQTWKIHGEVFRGSHIRATIAYDNSTYKVLMTGKVHDGGWGARHDRYAYGVTGTVLTPYPIIGGPGVTIR